MNEGDSVEVVTMRTMNLEVSLQNLVVVMKKVEAMKEGERKVAEKKVEEMMAGEKKEEERKTMNYYYHYYCYYY